MNSIKPLAEQWVAVLRKKAKEARMSECKYCGELIEWREYFTKEGEPKKGVFQPRQVAAQDLAHGDWLLTEDGKWIKIHGGKLKDEFYAGIFGSIRHNCPKRSGR